MTAYLSEALILGYPDLEDLTQSVQGG